MDTDKHRESWFQMASLEDLATKCRTPLVIDAACVLFENVKRIHTGLVMLPLNFVGIAARLQGCYSTAVFEITGKPNLSDEERTSELEASLVKRMMELVREEQEEDMKTNSRPFFEKSASLWEMITHLYLCDENKEGLLAIRESIVINVWSAIEIALEKVWDDSIATLPHVKARTGDDKRITRLVAAKYGLEVPKVRFRAGKEKLKSVQAIREAYARGFAIDCIHIDNALASTELEALALVRNLLVHKRGRIDSDYTKRAPYLPSLAKLFDPAAVDLRLSGPIASTLVSEGIEAVVKVLRSVDHWIEKHP